MIRVLHGLAYEVTSPAIYALQGVAPAEVSIAFLGDGWYICSLSPNGLARAVQVESLDEGAKILAGGRVG